MILPYVPCGCFALGTLSETYFKAVVVEVHVFSKQIPNASKSPNVNVDTKITNRIGTTCYLFTVNTFWVIPIQCQVTVDAFSNIVFVNFCAQSFCLIALPAYLINHPTPKTSTFGRVILKIHRSQCLYVEVANFGGGASPWMNRETFYHCILIWLKYTKSV